MEYKEQESDRSGFRTVTEIFERFISIARPNACFGEPVSTGDRTIIPAADVMCGMGVGIGSGEGQAEPDGGGKPQRGSGSGGGGGGFTRSRPVAVVVVSPDGVTVEPVVDATQIAMAGVAAGAFLGFWLMRMGGMTGGAKGPSLRSIRNSLKA